VNKTEDRIKTLTEAWQDAEKRAMERKKRIDELESEDWCRTALEYQARVKELEADLAKSHDDGYDMGWREALEIAQEKIMRIGR
jgi:hypothetical protein